ncbi:MAG: riboflavin synthase [Thiohalomonadaceae bacterium]
MFTGIIQAIGRIQTLRAQGADMTVRVASGSLDLADVQLGDSIAVNGVCLTVTALHGDGFSADVSGETLRNTSFASLQIGSAVNLEKALTLASRLGGHLVSGHVDGLGELLERRDEGRSVLLRVKAPAALARYIAHKGSITVDGVSLTVNAVDGAVFSLNIVPHSLAQTTLQDCRVGQQLNLEVDLIARYLERLLQGEAAARPISGGISTDFLAQHGFMR